MALYYSTAYHGGSHIHAHGEPEVPSILEPAVVRTRGRPRREDTQLLEIVRIGILEAEGYTTLRRSGADLEDAVE